MKLACSSNTNNIRVSAWSDSFIDEIEIVEAKPCKVLDLVMAPDLEPSAKAKKLCRRFVSVKCLLRSLITDLIFMAFSLGRIIAHSGSIFDVCNSNRSGLTRI